MKRNNEGFTLIEVMVSILVLGLVVIPICSGLIMAVRINEQAEDFLQAKLAVSSAMETMMAKGISEESGNYIWYEEANPYPEITVKTEQVIQEGEGENPDEAIPCYRVTVSYKGITKDPITVTTVIRQASFDGEEGGGGE